VPAYARVVATAVKLPEGQVVPTILDPRFPTGEIVLYPDTASVSPGPLVRPFPVSAVKAEVTDWEPGKMRIALTGTDQRPSYLIVSENWYPDWTATVDGKHAPLLRADHALLSVVIPPGAKEVALRFDSPTYAEGKRMSGIALLLAFGMVLLPFALRRKQPSA
jgi:hypothetical protein